MNKFGIVVLATIVLLLSTSIMGYRVTANAIGYPSAEAPTLMTSLSPPNVTLGNNVTWLIWTDPNCSGCMVNLKIYDVTNSTEIYETDEALRTLNNCGSLIKVISTAGFQQHEYRFTAKIVKADMEIESSKYLDFTPPIVAHFTILTYAFPYEAIPGEDINLTIIELYPYPYVDALANIRVYNTTHASLWTLTNLTIPATNGSRSVNIPTAGLDAGYYGVNVTATSAVGDDSDLTSFTLSDIIVRTDKFAYLIGDMVNVSIRTYPSISEVGLSIFTGYFPMIIVVDENVTLTNGVASRLYDSTSWTPGFYSVFCNATMGIETIFGFTGFSLGTFMVDVQLDKFEYVAGEIANITVSTTPPQPNAELINLTITNSTADEIWTYGPSTLSSNGDISVLFNTTGLPPDYYSVEAFVNNSKYVVSGDSSFEVSLPLFDIFASVEPYSNTGYAMPCLNITVTPQQLNSNLTIEIDYPETYYSFTRRNFSISTYTYFVPAIALPNGTYWLSISVTSAIGTNSTESSFKYSNGIDSDEDGLSNSQEQTIGTLSLHPDSDGDGFFDGMEVFHGSDPLDPISVIPEELIFSFVATLSMVSAFSLIKTKLARAKRKTS